MDYEINGANPDLWYVGNQQGIATSFGTFLEFQGWTLLYHLYIVLLLCTPSLQLLKSQSWMSWISSHFSMWRKHPKTSIQESCISPFLHHCVGGLFSHASTGAELYQQLKQLCAPIVNDEYLWCTSQWNAERKELEKDRGIMRSQVRIFLFLIPSTSL